MRDDRSTEQPVPAPAPGDVTQPAPTLEPPAFPAAPPAAAPSPTPPAAAPAAAPEAAPRPGGSLAVLRSVAVGLVFFLTCLSLVLATTTWWLHDTVLDTDQFVELTAPLVEDPAVADAIATVASAQVGEALDLGPVGQYVVAGITREIVSSDAFAAVWERGLRFVHTQVVALLRDETSVVQLVDGMLVVNLYPVLDRILEQLQGLDFEVRGEPIVVPDITNPDDPAASRAELEAALGRPLSPTFGVIPIAEAERLEAAQRLVSLFDAFVVALFVVSGLLAVLTVALARRRLRMVALLGMGGLAALLAARLIVSAAADGLASSLIDAGPGAIIGGQVVEQIAASYRDFAQVVLLVGLVAAVVATVVAWLLESDARARPGPAGVAAAADGWFLVFAGLSIALAALILVGFTAVTLAIATGGFVIWVAVVVRMRRPAALEAG
jgi:hypothetical protein